MGGMEGIGQGGFFEPGKFVEGAMGAVEDVQQQMQGVGQGVGGAAAAAFNADPAYEGYTAEYNGDNTYTITDDSTGDTITLDGEAFATLTNVANEDPPQDPQVVLGNNFFLKNDPWGQKFNDYDSDGSGALEGAELESFINDNVAPDQQALFRWQWPPENEAEGLTVLDFRNALSGDTSTGEPFLQNVDGKLEFTDHFIGLAEGVNANNEDPQLTAALSEVNRHSEDPEEIDVGGMMERSRISDGSGVTSQFRISDQDMGG